MSHVEQVSIVPSGKVYGQLFEAQSLLSRKLSEAEHQREESIQIPPSSHPKLHFMKKLLDFEHKEKFQKNIQTFPHDKAQSSIQTAEMKEIKALPEMIVYKHSSSDISKKIKERRRKLHQTALEDMYQELGIINSKIEVRIENCCSDFCQKVKNVDNITEKLLEFNENEKKLMDYTFEEFNRMQEDAQSHTECKMKYVYHLDYKFNEIENDRIAEIQNVLAHYMRVFEEIAFLTTPEVHRLMESEVQIINQTLLNNKQNYTDIYTQLLLVHIDQDRKHHLNWKSTMTLWENKNIQKILERFRQFMLTSVAAKPKELQSLLDNIGNKLSDILNEYNELLQSLRSFIPPKCTKALVAEWYGKINEVTNNLKKEKREFLKRIHEEYEKCNRLCLANLEKEKLALVETKACTKGKAADLSTRYMLPLIQLQQKNFECSLATWDEEIGKEMACTTSRLDKVYAYISAIADIWLNHTKELDNQEEMLNQVLKESRDKHNNDNQAEETRLDTVLDTLRQGIDPTVLETNLNSALNILSRLKMSYQSFHAKQISITAVYIPMVKETLQHYEKDICKFFRLKKYSREPQSQSDENIRCICSEQSESASTTTNSSKISSSKASTSSNVPPPKLSVVVEKPSDSETDEPATESDSPEAVLITKQCTQYYYYPESYESFAFIEDQELATKQMHITSDCISGVKTQICMNILNHLDLWLVEAVKRYKQSLDTKVEELDAELSLRNHLHQPRAKRIKEDIHDVRKDELLMHSKRIADHCQGVEDAFTDMKTKLNMIKDCQDALMAKFEMQVDDMEPGFVNISKSDKLVTLRNKLTLKINKLMADIRKILRDYRCDFEQELQRVKDSNAKLMLSLKPFSEMGNFSPEEIQQYQKLIDKLALKVDQFEGKILSEMEGMETARYDQANKITFQFEERFKNHAFDLQYIEIVSRWFTNTQVKIKSDVAKCNRQADDINNSLERLEKKVDYLSDPHPDKVKCTPSELIADLSNTLPQFCSRAIYLISPKSGKDSGVKLSPVNVLSEVPAICKAGKLGFDDVSVIVAKNILRNNKILSNMEAEKSNGTPTDAVGSTSNYYPDSKVKLSTKKSLTQLRKHQTVYISQEPDSKSMFEQMLRLGKIKKPLLAHKIRQKLFTGDLEIKESEDGELEILYDFLGIIRQYLQITFDNVHIISDDYYRIKGIRPVTRPQVIQDNIELCTAFIKRKLKYYYSQATEYIARCQNEFNEQIQQFESIASRIPGVVMDQHFKDHTNSMEAKSKEKRKIFEEKLEEFQAKQASNREQLQPNLGHPQMKEDLKQLNDSEKEQHEALMAFMESHFQKLRAEVIKESGPFLKELCTISESLLQLYDAQFKDTLQRKENKPKLVLADVYALVKNIPMHERTVWTGLPLKEFYTQMSLESPFPKAVSAPVTTSKSMFPHHKTVKARNQTFQMYKEFFKNMLQKIEREEKDALERETKRWENWQASVKNIQNLYK